MKRQLFRHFRILAVVGLFGLTACGKINDLLNLPNKIDSMNGKMDSMNSNLGKVDSDSHLQVLDNSWKEMTANADVRVPDNPASMEDRAKAFADEASADELLQFVKKILLQIRNVQPDGSSQVHGTQPTDLLDQLNRDAHIQLTGLQAVMGWVSQDKIEQMVSQVPDGLYADWVYPALMLRAMSIWGYLWTADLHDTMNNMAEFEQAVQYADAVDDIVNLPFAAKIQVSVSIPSADPQNPFETISWQLVPQKNADGTTPPLLVDAKEFWTEIQTAVEVPAFVSAVKSDKRAEYNQLKAKVAAKVQRYLQQAH